MNWTSPLLTAEPRYQGQRGPDRGKRRSKINSYVLAELAKAYKERQAAFELYSVESVARRLGISRSAVFKAWAELKK